MKTIHLSLCLLASSLLCIAFSGCGNVRWAVPTVYEVYDLGNQNRVRDDLTRALQANNDPYGFKLESAESPYRFTLTKVSDMHQLMEVERIIRDVTKRNNVPVDLQIALLKFQSVEGTAGTAIIVRGTATAGSTVYLDVGQSQPVVIQNVNADGRWEAPVQPNKKLQERRGFIYGMVLKGSTKLFIRINIFNPTKCEPIPLSDLPRESVLRPLAK